MDEATSACVAAAALWGSVVLVLVLSADSLTDSTAVVRFTAVGASSRRNHQAPPTASPTTSTTPTIKDFIKVFMARSSGLHVSLPAENPENCLRPGPAHMARRESSDRGAGHDQPDRELAVDRQPTDLGLL